ncbi:MAG: rane dipeptidase [Actinomycetota bacterium]|nr:rane dipeptidase [Actinomycetota bacterium]
MIELLQVVAQEGGELGSVVHEALLYPVGARFNRPGPQLSGMEADLPPDLPDDLPADVLDAHVESFVWTRVLGYDLVRGHGRGLLGGRLYSQLDVPRMRAAGMTGGVFSIATNPFRSREGRRMTLAANIARLQAVLESDPGVAVVADVAGYRRARAEGRMGCFVAVQGGNAVGPDDVSALPDVVSRVTVVHLTRSGLGSPSRPLAGGGGRGLTPAGRDYVRALDARRVVVDLAHVNGAGFWDALAAHDRSVPAIVSHTGVRGVHDVWRNVDDAQIRAIADTGGVVGIMFHAGFLGGRTADAVVRHLAHVVKVGGEDSATLGSDWDGLIVPPRDMRTVSELPVLVAAMRKAGFSEDLVRKIVGANYLRVVESVRG